MILQSDKACEAEVVNHQDNTSGSICEIHIYLGFKSSLLLEQKLTGNSYILWNCVLLSETWAKIGKPIIYWTCNGTTFGSVYIYPNNLWQLSSTNQNQLL